ncbi:MAG: nucleotidyltransferase domain-containing protein [Minisyncoccia bacterium]|jgi:predicted nucleotidyltransferase
MGKYFEFLLERKQKRERFLENIDYYINLIKERAKNNLGEETKIYLFGSYLTENFGPNSDIDILVITENEIDQKEKSRVLSEILEDFDVYHPFEIHFASKSQFENWYKKFLKENYKEI